MRVEIKKSSPAKDRELLRKLPIACKKLLYWKNDCITNVAC